MCMVLVVCIVVVWWVVTRYAKPSPYTVRYRCRACNRYGKSVDLNCRVCKWCGEVKPGAESVSGRYVQGRWEEKGVEE